MSEFSIIENYFQNKTIKRNDVVLGIGDDGALLKIPSDQLLVITVDTLIAGVHFPLHTSAFDIAYKSLAVNLSDLAAMGAEPAWITLALSMPECDEDWLTQFSAGLFTLADRYQLQLIGGDTTQGPLSITIQAHGYVPPTLVLQRQGAKPGDKIYVSGTLGDAGWGLKMGGAAQPYFLERLNKPTPRVELGLMLRGLASSAIDISDGLLADLQHLLKASQVGAVLDVATLPLSPLLIQDAGDEAIHLALSAGDDYELCFTVDPENEAYFQSLLEKTNIECACIGAITASTGLELPAYKQSIVKTGYQHFTGESLRRRAV